MKKKIRIKHDLMEKSETWRRNKSQFIVQPLVTN